MEAAMTLARAYATSPGWTLGNIDPTRQELARRRSTARAEASPLRIHHASPEIGPEQVASHEIFNAIQALYLSSNRPRDKQIADRIRDLNRDAIAEDERILIPSLKQLQDFFLRYPDLAFPRITLTPDGTIRVRWIQGPSHFVAIEFTGKPLVKLVAEIPRDDGQTSHHFNSDYIHNIMKLARSIGATLAQ
jgi:hypothetical protein